jgi:acetylornithine/succinyldiaminopimelate/putrescine aminotransferase
VHVATQSYLRDVHDFCRDKGLLFVLDEVQTGVGRLGTLWGFERWGVEPDIMTLAKGLGGGVPIGAVLAKEPAAVFEPGDHGSTFGGNPLMCAVAHAVVTYILENDVLGNVNRVGGTEARAAWARNPGRDARGDGRCWRSNWPKAPIGAPGHRGRRAAERDEARRRSAWPRRSPYAPRLKP